MKLNPELNVGCIILVPATNIKFNLGIRPVDIMHFLFVVLSRIEQLKALLDEPTTSESDSSDSSDGHSKHKKHKKTKKKSKKEKSHEKRDLKHQSKKNRTSSAS